MWISLIGDQSTTIHNKTPIQLLEIKKKVDSKSKTFLLKVITLASESDHYEILQLLAARSWLEYEQHGIEKDGFSKGP